MPQSIQNLHQSNMSAPTLVLHAKGLFGESTQLPDVVHCETIAARSSLHDWELAPHQHAHLHQLLLVQKGSGVAHLEGRPVALTDRSLVNTPAGAVHAFRFAPGTQGFVVTLADEILDLILAAADDVRLVLRRPALCTATVDMVRIVQRIWTEFTRMDAARALVLRSLCGTLLGLSARQLAQRSPAPESTHSALLQRFDALIEAHALAHWRVADYARVLSISTTHLSRVIRTATGAPASQRIDAYLMREARQRLAYTPLRVATIADDLGFADAAHFSHAFKRAVGLSPRAFRQRLTRPTRTPGC